MKSQTISTYFEPLKFSIVNQLLFRLFQSLSLLRESLLNFFTLQSFGWRSNNFFLLLLVQIHGKDIFSHKTL